MIRVCRTRNFTSIGTCIAAQRTPHHEILRNGGLSYEGKVEFPVLEQWTIDSLIGNIYSSSRVNQRVLGSRAAAFEAEIRDVLAPHATADFFEQNQTYAVEFARRAA